MLLAYHNNDNKYQAAIVHRDQFSTRFDVGVPLDASEPNRNDRVMILYNDPKSLPDDEALQQQVMGNGDMPMINDLDEATKNCDVVDIVLMQIKTKKQCR